MTGPERAIPQVFLNKWQETSNVMAGIFDVPAGLIMRVLPEQIEVLVSSHTPGNPYEASEKASLNTGLYCETVMATRAVLQVPHALEDARWIDNPDVALNMISYLGVPLLWPDDTVFGTICVLDNKKRLYQQKYVDLLWEIKKAIEADFIVIEQQQELLASNSNLLCANHALSAINADLNMALTKIGAMQTELLRAERRQAEAERAARKSAEAANTAKSAFLANMSHELRTPLNGILGYAQILQRDLTLGERQLAGVNVIRHSGEHLLTLINDILDLAKIEAGKMELYLVDLQLAGFARTLVEMVEVKAVQKGLAFVCDLAPDLLQSVRVDETRLRQVLLNLLSNAVKFTDHGQVTLRVRAVSPARLRFEVQDSGVGISTDQLGALFQPFEQVGEAQRRLGGTGLGLAISRQYVRLMGGNIQVESRVGQGSTFWFELDLPVVVADTAKVSARIVTGYDGPRRKVLVVEDVAGNRAVVADLLTPLGFEVVAAVNGREGLEMAQRLQPHLILMDIAMPEMDGLEATRRLRELPAFQDVPIIVLSASVSASDSEQCLAVGANAFLPKPINVDRLLSQIATLLPLEWVYDYRPEAEPTSERDASEAFVVPPQPEMAVLYRLARIGNMQEIMAHAAYLAELDPRYGPFVSQLRVLAKSYQSKAIVSLVERCLNGSQVQ